MNEVKVLFEDSKHNHIAKFSDRITEEMTRNYFVGATINVQIFPYEYYPNKNYQKCIDIEFIKGEKD